MLLEFVAAIVVGFGCAGAALILGRLSRGRLPSWLVPVAAGAGMLGFVIWSEYTWAGRVIGTLPAEVTLASQNRLTSWYRPWTYVWPLTNRLTLIDHRFSRRNEAFPDLLMTAVVMMARWEPGRQIPVVFDCARARRADLGAEVVIAEDGTIEGADWLQLPADDPLLRAACTPPAV